MGDLEVVFWDMYGFEGARRGNYFGGEVVSKTEM